MTPAELAEIRATGERRIAERRALWPALRDAEIHAAGEAAVELYRLRAEVARLTAHLDRARKVITAHDRAEMWIPDRPRLPATEEEIGRAHDADDEVDLRRER